MTLNEIEIELGDPSSFILTSENAPLLRKWAVLKGTDSFHVHNNMSMIDLANLYHKEGSENKPTDEQSTAAKMFVDMAKAFERVNIDPELIREIVIEEIAKLPAKKIEIITPTHTHVFNEKVHYKTEIILKIASLNHPVMMVGPAGCGKTSIGKHVAEALKLPFYITSTVNDTYELMGFVDGYGNYKTTPFREAFENGGVWVGDELDAWDAAALLVANSAIANGYATFPDKAEPILRHENFRVITTANTYGSGADRIYVGRNELDAASTDRFATIDVNYDLELERSFARGNDKWLNFVWKIRKLVEDKKIRHVVSSRAIIMGAIALEAGIKLKDVEQIYLFKGMSETDRKKLGDIK